MIFTCVGFLFRGGAIIRDEAVIRSFTVCMDTDKALILFNYLFIQFSKIMKY